MQCLTAPAPHVLASIAEVEQLDMAHLELPIVEFAPFAGLSVPPTAARVQATELRPQTVASATPFDPPAKKPGENPTMSDATDRATPIFSLRSPTREQSRNATSAQSLQQVRNRFEPELGHEMPHPRGVVATDNETQRVETVQPQADFSLPEKIPLSAFPRQKDAPVPRETLSWIEVVSQAINGLDLANMSRTTVLTNSGDPQAEVRGKEQQAVRDTNRRSEQHRSGSADGGSPPSVRQWNSHVEELTSAVVSQTRKVSQSMPSLRTGSVSIPADRVADSPVSPLTTPAPIPWDSSLDGEEIAALVNDILIEQARRNGVDLS
jgi:hypothetical protein